MKKKEKVKFQVAIAIKSDMACLMRTFPISKLSISSKIKIRSIVDIVMYVIAYKLKVIKDFRSLGFNKTG